MIDRYTKAVLTIIACALVAAPAAAQSSTSIQAFLRQSAPSCQLVGYEENYRGIMAGAEGPVAVATYTLEGCGGGSNWSRTVDVFQDAGGGKVRHFKPPNPPIEGPDIGNRGGVVVSSDHFTVQALTLGPDDAHCCPTVRVIKSYRILNGAVVPAR
jgi:hypothetical protein